MRRVILLVLLAFVSSNALAEWVKVGASHDNSAVSYVNTDTVFRKKYGIIVWTILDFSQAQAADGQTYLSIKSQQDFDCKDKQVKILYTALHAENMGNGKAIYSDSVPMAKKPVSHNSMLEDIWEYACGIK
jgi:hypothetical protein